MRRESKNPDRRNICSMQGWRQSQGQAPSRPAGRPGQRRGPTQCPHTPAYACSLDRMRWALDGQRTATVPARGPTPRAQTQLMGGGVNPRTGRTGELTGNGLQVAGHSRLPRPHLTGRLQTSRSAPRTQQQDAVPIRLRTPLTKKTRYLTQESVFLGTPCLCWTGDGKQR